MRLFVFLTAILICTWAQAEEVDPGGVLNPDEMSLNRALEKAINGEVGMVVCSQGYLMTKKGSHEEARQIFENCAKQGYTGTMTWMSYMDHNGLGAKEDAEAAAAWDKKAADLGDPIGQFNYGLDLLRGHGVEQNLELGKHYIDQAARNGVKDAITVQESDYDFHVVTPDGDNWKYEKRVF